MRHSEFDQILAIFNGIIKAIAMLLRNINYLLLMILMLSTTANAQLGNGSFESWNDTLSIEYHDIDFIDSSYEALPLEWSNIYGDLVAPIGSYRTTDAVDGEFALVTMTWYTYQITTLSQKGEITYRPNKFKGDYKYLQMAILDTVKDSASISIVLLNDQEEEIGSGHIYLDTISEYSSFELDIDYSSEEIPSSYYIELQNAQRNCFILDAQCNYFFVDNLRFALETNVKDRFESNVICYPNPNNGKLFFTEEISNCKVYDINGRLVSNYNNINYIHLPTRSTQYFIKLIDKNGNIHHQKIIKI